MDGRVLIGVTNDETDAVGGEVQFVFEREDDRNDTAYTGGSVDEDHLLRTIEGGRWDGRYGQRHEDRETPTGHSRGTRTALDDGRILIEDRWQLESKTGGGSSMLEEIPDTVGASIG